MAIPAAGLGRRIGGQRKAWIELAGEPLLLWSLRVFLAHPDTTDVVVALSPDDVTDPPDWIGDVDPRVSIVSGGPTRAESVRLAVRALPNSVEWIVIHDAARPLVTREALDRCLEVARRGRGAVAGWPVADTLKRVDVDQVVRGTVERDGLWAAQTPQAFPAAMIREAYEAMSDPAVMTDDAAVVERSGGTVVMVRGSSDNIKVTRPEDLALAEALLRLRRTPGQSG